MSLENKLPEDEVSELISKYADTVNQYGLGSKEQQEMYESTTKQHPEIKDFFMTINNIKANPSRYFGEDMPLESKLSEDDSAKEGQKPDWKQWLPVYGIYKIRKDSEHAKPVIMDSKGSPRDILIGTYHLLSGISVTLATAAGIAYGIEALIEKLF